MSNRDAKFAQEWILLKLLTDEGLLNPGPSLPFIFWMKKIQSVKQLFSHTCCQLSILVFAISVCFQQIMPLNTFCEAAA